MHTTIENLLCFDVTFDVAFGSFVPSIYLRCDDDLDYIDKKITLTNAVNFEIFTDNLAPFYKVLLTVAADFKIDLILKKFDKTKKIKSIADLRKDKVIDKLLNAFLDNKLNQFLSICKENILPLSVNLGNQKEFYNSKIALQNNALEPVLKFHKTENEIEYSLQLSNASSTFFPSNHKIAILTNEPSWIVVDRKLYQVDYLNSNKLKPFLKQKTTYIANKNVVAYFEKFIKTIVQKVSIEATGFEVETKNTIKKCSIALVNNFFKNRFELSLNFDYDGFIFSSNSKQNSHSIIDIPDLEHIKIFHYKRNFESEKEFEDQLISFGFEKTFENNFNLNSEDSFAAIQFIINNKSLFAQHNFEIENLKIDGKTIQTEIAVLNAESTEKQDWFDLKMTIVCGEHRFAFSKIIPNIKNKNRLFELPDGSYFVIPSEWISDYSGLVNFAIIENEQLTLPKSNYKLLENIHVFKSSLLPEKKADFSISKLVKATLRPYQIEGVQWLLSHYQNHLGACLADDMGLGKTLQTLSVLVAVQEDLSLKNTFKSETPADLFSEIIPQIHALKALIILPSSLLFNWYNEAKKFTPHFKMIIYSGNKRTEIANRLKNYDLVFTSYNIISKDISTFEKINFSYLILDESQYIKNKNSQVFKNINKINAAHKISLSGTPIENSLADLWSQMQFINPNILGTYKFFQNYFQIPIQKNKDENKMAELKQIINPFILRRTKKQVLTELPNYSETIFLSEMLSEQEKWYEQEKSKARNRLLNIDANTNKIHVLNSLMRLRQWSNHPKIVNANSEIASGKFADVTNYLETLVKSNQKVLVFSSFVSHLKLYQNWATDNEFMYCFLTGETKNTDREIEVNRFKNNPEISLFFLSVGAGNVGLNLQEATFVVFLDPWWNPFKEIQAISRAHRMGQKNKVEVVKFIAKNTIEEKIIELQKAKKLLAENIIDDTFIPIEIEQNLDFLLQ